MNIAPMPPLRTSHVRPTMDGVLSYDLWGVHGRPVLLLSPVLFDRAMWWPVAAELRPHATVIAPDLPGHGGSSRRERYDPDEILADLAGLVDHLGVRRAPVVVGHASAAALAERFAAAYATRAVVAVDPWSRPTDPAVAVAADPDSYLAAMQLEAVPPQYRDLVRPVADTRLLAAYTACRSVPQQRSSGSGHKTCTRVAVHSTSPALPGNAATPPGAYRQIVYDVAGRFAHLANVNRFVGTLRALL